MAKIVKMRPSDKSGQQEEVVSFEDFMDLIQREITDKGVDIPFPDDEEEDDEGFDDEAYLMGMKLPKHKFIGESKQEFHIRIKLNQAPVNIWRELVVPSNITLEMLAYVLTTAMGWEHEHLYQFIGEKNLYYMNSRQIREEADSFMAFFARAQYKNSEKTSLEMVLQPKGERLRFEYDFCDSWMHELWVKGARDYAPGEEPVIKLIKAHG